MLDLAAHIKRRHRQLIVHSFLYYMMGESLIADTTFDEWAREVQALHKAHPQEAAASPYFHLCKGFDSSTSGFFLDKLGYPPELAAVAARLLWMAQAGREDFDRFLARYGLRRLM